MRADYPELAKRVAAFVAGEDDPIALMATVACEIHHADDRFDWTGFYRVAAPRLLKIGPYQGAHGCLSIPFDKGVCGACARSGEVQIVNDVTAVPDRIACDGASQSEIVLPVTDGGGSLIAVLDIDSNQPAAFDQSDADGLSAILRQVFSDHGQWR